MPNLFPPGDESVCSCGHRVYLIQQITYPRLVGDPSQLTRVERDLPDPSEKIHNFYPYRDRFFPASGHRLASPAAPSREIYF